MPIHFILCKKMVKSYVSLLSIVPHEPISSLLTFYCGQLSLTDHRADDKVRLVLENEAIGQDTRPKKSHFEPFPHFHYIFLVTLLTRTPFSWGDRVFGILFSGCLVISPERMRPRHWEKRWLVGETWSLRWYSRSRAPAMLEVSLPALWFMYRNQ